MLVAFLAPVYNDPKAVSKALLNELSAASVDVE